MHDAADRLLDVPGFRTQRTTLMDRRGEGVQVILRNREALSGRRPRYEMLGESELRLTIFAAEFGGAAGS